MTELTIADGDLISRNESVVGADVMDEAILIDIDSGYFFQLNKSATHIWNLIEEPRAFADLCVALQARFKAAPEGFRAEVTEFVADMQDRGLLKVASA